MEVTAEDQGLIVANLEQLLKLLQSEQTTLTREQSQTSSSSMSQTDHFDFFGLPMELRTMILRHVLCSPSGRITSGHYNWKPRWDCDCESEWECDCEPSNLEGLEVLWANRQLSSEAMAVMEEINTLVWTFDYTEDLPGSIAMRDQFASSVSSFRRTGLNFVLYDVHISTTTENEQEPNGALVKLVDAIQTAVHAGRAPTKLSIDVYFTIYDGDSYPYILHDYAAKCSRNNVAAVMDEGQEDRLYLCGFLRLQLQHMLKKHHDILAGLPGVKLRSDVEHDVDNGIQWLRCSDDLAVFKDSTRRNMGLIRPIAGAAPNAEWTMEVNYARSYDENTVFAKLMDLEDEDIYPE